MGILGVRSEGEELGETGLTDRQTDSAGRVGTRERAPAVIERIRRDDAAPHHSDRRGAAVVCEQ